MKKVAELQKTIEELQNGVPTDSKNDSSEFAVCTIMNKEYSSRLTETKLKNEELTKQVETLNIKLVEIQTQFDELQEKYKKGLKYFILSRI